MFQELTSRQLLLGNDCAVGVQRIGIINKDYAGLVKTLTNVKYIPELRKNLISTGTLGVLGFKYSGGHGKTRFYKHGKQVLQETFSGSLYLLDRENCIM